MAPPVLGRGARCLIAMSIVYLVHLVAAATSTTMFQTTNDVIDNAHPEIVVVRPPDRDHKDYASYMKEKIDSDSIIVRYAPKSMRKRDVAQFWEMVDTPRYLLSQSREVIEKEIHYCAFHGQWSDRVIMEKMYYSLLYGSTGEGPPLQIIDTTNAVHYDHTIMSRFKYASGLDDVTKEELKEEAYHIPVPVEYVMESNALDSWKIGDYNSDFCEWSGVKCRDGKVVELNFAQKGLAGTLPHDISGLSALEVIRMDGNKLHGTIPNDWIIYTGLRTINFSDNQLTGTIPTTFSYMENLLEVNFAKNNFEGEMVDTSVLRRLEHLDISKNSFHGTVSSRFTALNTRLKVLKIGENQLTGPLPKDFSLMERLEHFDASQNELTGTIPPNLFELPRLVKLSLSRNSFRGTLPSEFLLATSLRIFEASYNHLTGKIPRGDDVIPLVGMMNTGPPVGGMWSDLVVMTQIDLTNNAMTGILPPEMLYGLRTSLGSLQLSYNAFSGTISKEIGRVERLAKFEINSNYFSGTLPSELNKLKPNLRHNFTDNHFVGTVPKLYCSVRYLAQAEFGCDAVLCPAGTFHPTGAATVQSGCRPCTVTYEGESLNPPRSQILGRTQCDHVRFVEGDLNGDGILSNREALRLMYVNTIGRNWGEQFRSWMDMKVKACDLRGVTCTGKVITKIDFSEAVICSDGKLRVGSKYLCHGIPAELSKLTTLETLIFARKQFLRGSIPSEFGLLTRLKHLDFTGCTSLTGKIPRELGELTRLKFLSFSGCQITGTFPPELFELPKLEKLHISMAPISGTIPRTIGGLSRIKELLISRNSLTGSIPEQIGYLSTLENLEIYGNSIVGLIPESIGGCTSLKRVDFFNNNLTGSIPESLAKVPTLQIVHLKMNNLTGLIPSEFGELKFLSWFDISSNNLYGTIPSTFGSAKSLKDFRVADNMLYSPVPPSLCASVGINGGAARTHKCDGVVCPLGWYSPSGHATESEGCRKCPSGQTTMYLGSTECYRLTEKDYLSMFFEVMRGHEWEGEKNENWQDYNKSVCKWAGISCDENEKKIESIKFPLSTYYDDV